MAPKKIPKPAWYKNTYFWIAGILFILCIVGMVSGDASIRDPGQKREGGLWLLYLVASGIMLLNGWISHSQTVQHYRETVGEDVAPKAVAPTPTTPPADTVQPQPVEKTSEGTKDV
ncbi:MAG TPA: hypothetical protein VHE55_09290 [Fimbriimonadaceae bacterium]|nr:hypothetical protein [Fimbriimonadaceae bacterium]